MQPIVIIIFCSENGNQLEYTQPLYYISEVVLNKSVLIIN